jgi:hypothetical protein
MSGLHRRDINRIQRNAPPPKSNVDLVARVVGHWQSKKNLQDDEGRPRVLTSDGEHAEFSELVRSISRELQPRAVLEELERVGAVEHAPKGVRLLVSSFAPKPEASTGFEFLGKDIRDLLGAISENVLED